MSAIEINLNNKVILVTGAAGGIGRRLAERGLDAGARLSGFDLKNANLDHPNFINFIGDVTNEDEVALCVSRTAERFGRIDALINNAGIVGSGRVQDTSLADWSSVLDTNLTGAFLFSKHSIPHLIESRGAIVNLSSTNGLTGGSSLSGAAYACSKAGIIALTKNLAKELAEFGVRANCIAPGPVDTEMIGRFGADGIEDLRQSIPLKALATADDVADLAFFMISDAAKHITGATVSLSGGLVMH
ncbi:MAG: SDR family oxidoreductase [Acidobacteria bacterium]|nr:SDR family oxidoreductase [Acidobacteriota bacterium]MBK8147993.1 SDR family oxidoreductase [Acidobacteriota bacterium]